MIAAILLIALIAVCVLSRLLVPKPSAHQLSETRHDDDAKHDTRDGHQLSPIEPLPDFDYTKVPPIHYRPFLTMAHVSLGVKKMPRDDWIRIDSGYLDRIQQRRTIMREHAADALGTSPVANPAIAELYTEVMAKHLPQRFPTMFRIIVVEEEDEEGGSSGSSEKRRRQLLLNLATGTSHSLDAAELTHAEMLRNLGESVEEDLYIMCPDEQGEIRLQGYVACFPGGFLSFARVGMSMREIHRPVPGYTERIAKGADRHLERLSPGKYIGRMNWSLQVDGPELFRLDGANNFYPEKGDALPEDEDAVDISTSYLRVEHQTLNRLPKTKAVIFCVRSYLTSLEDIKREGNGPLLLEAIQSMPEKLGNYKKRPFWRRAVYDYLGS